jgi:hypothetical protein
MKKSYLLSGMIAFGAIVGINASEARRPETYKMLDVAVGDLKNINWPAVFATLDLMPGVITVNEYRSSWGESLLYMAVMSANFIAAKELLEKYHANPNLGKTGFKRFKQKEETPLLGLLSRMGKRGMFVARKNDLTMVKLLLMYGADPYMQDSDGDCFWHAERIEYTEKSPLGKQILEILEPYRKK